jgi:hypothetical protein
MYVNIGGKEENGNAEYFISTTHLAPRPYRFCVTLHIEGPVSSEPESNKQSAQEDKAGRGVRLPRAGADRK